MIAGEYKDNKGRQGKYVPLDYYNIHLDPKANISPDVKVENTVMIFTLMGEVISGSTKVNEKTATRFDEGDTVTIEAGENGTEAMLISAPPFNEPVAWYGSIMMNTEGELRTAVRELNEGSFIKKKTTY